MNKIFQWAKKYWREHKVLSLIYAALFLVLIFYIYKQVWGSTATPQYILGQVRRGTIEETVTGTGQIYGQNEIGIKPQASGTVTKIAVKEGDSVVKGQPLIYLDGRSALISLNQAESNLQSAQASYDKTVAGAAPADVSISKVSYQNAQKNIVEKLNQSYIQIENTLHSNVDQLYQNPTSYSPIFQPSVFDSSADSAVNFTPTDPEKKISLGFERAKINTEMTDWKKYLDGISIDQAAEAATKSEGYLQDLRDFTNDLAVTVNSLDIGNSKYQSALDQIKSNVVSARNSVNSVVDGVISSDQSLRSAKADLDQKLAPARPEDVTSAKSQLDNSKSSLQSAENNYDNTIVRAPFDGVVAQVGIQEGDVAGSSAAVAVLTTKKKVVVVPLNEVDAAKVKIGDKATLTFDALPDVSSDGSVIQMDGVGTVSQGVVTYNIKIAVDSADEAIKSGMSASASIVSDSKDGVLVLPNSAVKSGNGGSYVLVLDNITPVKGQPVTTTEIPRQVKIETGLSNDAQTEIVSGLNEGDWVVIRTVSTTASKSQTTQTSSSSRGGLFGGLGGGGAARLGR